MLPRVSLYRVFGFQSVKSCQRVKNDLKTKRVAMQEMHQLHSVHQGLHQEPWHQSQFYLAMLGMGWRKAKAIPRHSKDTLMASTEAGWAKIPEEMCVPEGLF